MTEYTDLEVQQMIGRAGRPQYDTHGRAVVRSCAMEHELLRWG
jgi:replicative superfamily II helicase